MSGMRCPHCGETHDLSDMEPSFRWPDAYVAVPDAERAARTRGARDWCMVRDAAGAATRFFLRVVLPVPVRGDARPCNWGVWVEVDEPTYARVHELWSDDAQVQEPPFAARLANAVPTYPPTLGLPGTLRLTGPASVPAFRLALPSDHPLAVEQRDGVHPERVLEWLGGQVHGGW